jgi:hypothetical protein
MVMTQENDKNKSSYKSIAWRNLSEQWAFVESLWADSYSIRSEGKKHLHQFKREPDEKYDFRLKNSVFENDFRGTIEGLAGQVFRKDPSPQKVHQEILNLLPDIDGCGNSFYAFNQDSFELFLRDGNGAIFIDAPPIGRELQEKIDSGYKPTTQDRANDNPNWVYIKPSQILNYGYTKVGSKEILSRVTIEEKTVESDGEFGEKEVLRHRILRPGSFEVKVWDEEKKDFIDDPDMPQGKTGLDYIPLVPITRFDAKPPLMTLAMLNVLLYNKTSDFDDVMHIACTPRWIETYDSEEDAKAAAKLDTASAAVGKKIFGQNANAFYAEITGSGLELAKSRCQDIENRMQKFGLGMFAPTEVAPKTATEIEDASGRRESKLARYARQWQNAVEKALYITAEYINAIKGKATINLTDAEKGDLKMNIDYNRLTFSLEQMRLFDQLNSKGLLSNKTFLEKLALITEIDPVEEEKRLKAEAPMREAKQS